MHKGIAIIGIGCCYPDARSPVELWENVLAQRRAFRQIPPERLRLEDYFSADRSVPDHIYATEAALIEGYEFDRVHFRVVGSTFRSADLAHWLALDVASQALADAGFLEGEGLPRETTGVLLGNTLTGEFSRANALRLRWPYVRRVLEAALIVKGWAASERHAFLENLEAQYKSPFPPIGEETLAGGLSNTIAGRICNYFDLKGGGYTVDGACAASLLSVITACSALVAGDLDVALAGGVDLSLDPFELVGFAKAGALASEEMRVYDTRSSGFWPGEGCGFFVLRRYEDALAQHHKIYAVIRGWGISSDGSGGITRPEVDGQLLALRRAYRRAGFGIETITYFEGHGTGTSVGDTTELRVLSRARREAEPEAPPAVIGSIKANFGHTKAAAGIAGLIKTTMALHTQIVPPTTGCEEPHSELASETPALKVSREGQFWPADRPLRAGVSAMGFGGINTHIVLEGNATERRKMLTSHERALLSSCQDAELFLMSARDADELQTQVEHLLTFAARISRAELTDLSAALEKTLTACQMRAAIVASTPAELARQLETLKSWLTNGIAAQLDLRTGVFLSAGTILPRLGFLFPGQGSPAHLSGGAFYRRFNFVQELYSRAALPTNNNGIATEVAQPAIVTASLAALQALDKLGIAADIAVGHSLGEITALHWASAIDEETLLRIAKARGKAMTELSNPNGAMAGIGADPQKVAELLRDEPVVIAGLNSPHQTVVSGEGAGVDKIIARARAKGFKAVKLSVSHAFHSPLVATATQPLAKHLAIEDFRPLQRAVVSTVTGAHLKPDDDLRALLCRQVTSPVRFTEAITAATGGVNLFIEVGPGRALSGLLSEFVETPVIALDAGGPSLKGLLQAVGAAFVLGEPINHATLFAGRFARPFNLDWQPRFFVNPCELAPLPHDEAHDHPSSILTTPLSPIVHQTSSLIEPSVSPLELVRQLVAKRTELPPSAVKDSSRLLSDLHLNSITVGEIVTEAARRLSMPLPISPTEYADATVAAVAQALEELHRTGGAALIQDHQQQPPGVDSWIRAFTVELVERPLSKRQVPSATGSWRVITSRDHPLEKKLQKALDQAKAGPGVVVCLPPEPDEQHVSLLLEGARAVFESGKPIRFVLVQHGGGAAAFARTLHLEASEVTTCVVDVPPDHPKAIEWIIAEATSAVGYTEAHYDANGKRSEPVLRLLPNVDHAKELPLGPNDLLLVTGGGKGIAAECAFTLARKTGASLALLGRSSPDSDTELSANLSRMADARIHFRYIPADVTEVEAVRKAVDEAVTAFGRPVTAILHGAGANAPKLLRSLDEATFLQTLAPKVQGLRNLLAAINPDHLRLLITFGSIIARIGLRGEADYAVANEWLAHLTERWQAEHSHCRCLTIEWSVWSGIGMGQRLGRVDALMQQGITPIPPDEGIGVLCRLLTQHLPTVSVVVTGRFGEPPALKMEQPDLPFLRFLERPRVYYPGVELVVDAELSADTDPYLNDHVFRGERLFPAVMGLEAMAQAAMALAGTAELPVFENVQFSRPIVVSDYASVTIRIAALVREPDGVEVVVRCEKTAFQIDHFRARCRFEKRKPEVERPSRFFLEETAIVPINPERDLYGGILFHRGRFQRLHGYRKLRATECIAEIMTNGATDWFGHYLPSELILGDPAVRDAAMHAIQACIPHGTLLPIAVDRIRMMSRVLKTSGPLFVHAKERSCHGDTFIYDLEITESNGYVRERWEGLKLQRIQSITPQIPWAIPLLGPYIERRLQELVPGSATVVVVEPNNDFKNFRSSDRAIQHALGTTQSISRRHDGKPEVVGDHQMAVSATHAVGLVLAVAGRRPIGCDLELVAARPVSVWQELLGQERFKLAEMVSREAREDLATAATRVWAATECLKKAGAMIDAPLVLVSSKAGGWLKISAGRLEINSLATHIRDITSRLVFAVLLKNTDMRS